MLAIQHGDIRLDIDTEHGGRAVSWWVGEHQLLGASSGHPIEYGMYPMAPWAGRIRGNELRQGGVAHGFSENLSPWAIHGLVLDDPVTVVEHWANHCVLAAGFGEAWPFSGGVRCSWTLSDTELETELEIYSCGEDFPAVGGWHPWFLRMVGEVVGRWSTDCTEILERGGDSLPTGLIRSFDPNSGPFDDALTHGTRAVIDWPGVLSIEIENSHPWFVIFDAKDDFICIEPQTGPPDGLSGQVAPACMVTPTQPLVMRTRWQIRREPQAN
jgi:aldose 1-epimerase